MGATFNTGYLENLILYNGSNNIGIGTSADATYKVTLGGSLLGTSANFSGSVLIGTTTSFSSPLVTNIGAGAAGSLNNQIAMTHTGASTAYYIKTIRATASDEPEGIAFVQNATTRFSISSTGAATFSSNVISNGYFASDFYRDSRLQTLISYQGSNNIRMGSGTAADYLTFFAGATEKMTITTGGNVLIGSTGIYGGGTTNESELLVVGNPPTADTDRGLISFMDNRAYNTSTLGAKVMMGGAYNTAGAMTFFAGLAGLKENTTDGNYAGALAFYTRANGAASSERMRITSGGNVLIGTTTDQGRLTVAASAVIAAFQSTTSTQFNGLEMKNGGGSFYFGQDNSAGTFYGSNAAYAGSLYLSGNYPMAFFTNATERMRITNVGTVIVKGQNDDIVQVGDSISGHNAYLQLKAGSGGNAYVNSTGSGSLILGANGAASNHLQITSGGVIQATTDTLQWYDKKVKFYATYTSINGGASQNFDFSVGSNSQISILVRAGGRSNNPAGGMYHLFGYMFPSGFLSSYTIHANQISFSYSWVNSSTIRITVTNSQPSDAVNLNLQFEINSQFQQ